MTAEPTTRVIAADANAIGQAAHTLSAGGLVAFPTETVYGLGDRKSTRLNSSH